MATNLSQDVRWDEFEKYHVVRRLKEIIGKWWRVQINFTDSKGFLRGVPNGKFFNPLNPISKAIVADKDGFSDCVKETRQITIDTMSVKSARILRYKTGFSAISVPIRVDGKYLGCVFADGFVLKESEKEQKTRIKMYLEKLFPSSYDLMLKDMDNIPVLNSIDVNYLSELVAVVVDEMVIMQKSISEHASKVDELSKELGNRFVFSNMIGKSDTMQKLYSLVERVSDSETTVLIQGENGTGKELIAKALHYNSKRRKNKFIIVNCGAFNENLLESELFGHLKGSFTGANKDKVGLFEAVDKGTLFLDEVGDTSPSMQVKLLRVLQEGTFTPVGSTEVRSADVRVVAATNKNLEQMVQEGTFREDLYYRINVINITVPALRDIKEDIPLLAETFLERYAKTNSKPVKHLSKECLALMFDHDWPGNVRQLENEIERLCVLSGDDLEIEADKLSPRIQKSGQLKVQDAINSSGGKLKDAVDELERQLIKEGLERNGWNKSKLATELGISRAGLIMKVEKYGLDKRKTAL